MLQNAWACRSPPHLPHRESIASHAGHSRCSSSSWRSITWTGRWWWPCSFRSRPRGTSPTRTWACSCRSYRSWSRSPRFRCRCSPTALAACTASWRWRCCGAWPRSRDASRRAMRRCSACARSWAWAKLRMAPSALRCSPRCIPRSDEAPCWARSSSRPSWARRWALCSGGPSCSSGAGGPHSWRPAFQESCSRWPFSW